MDKIAELKDAGSPFAYQDLKNANLFIAIGFGTGDRSGDHIALCRRAHVLMSMQAIAVASKIKKQFSSFYKVRGETIRSDSGEFGLWVSNFLSTWHFC